MFNRFTERAQKIIILAQEEAKRLNHDYLGTEHLLLGLVALGEGVAVEVLRNLGVDLRKVRQEVEKIVGTGDNILISEEIPFTPRAKKVVELASEEARAMGVNFVGTEHILLGLLKEGEGVAAKILKNLGVTPEAVQKSLESLLGEALPSGEEPTGFGGFAPPGKKAKTKTPALDTFGRDLTRLAKEDKLDPVIGRKNEIERVVQILCRRTKNNPALLGEPGVGKTAIVEGLAQNIAAANVPEILLGKRVIALDLAGVVAGTKYRGEFEQRMKRLMYEIQKEKNNIILFIDEVHTLVGAGAAEGAIDASSMLKPALARGELQCIGATTLDEYRRYIEHDAALERRFQSVIINPPTVEETIEILKGLRDKYEAHHRVKITDEAIQAAAEFSDRYISDRWLPDKAIDLIDEAGAKARLHITTLPSDLKKREKEAAEVTKEKEDAIKNQEFEKAARLRDKERRLKEELKQIREKWEKKEIKGKPIGQEEIAGVVAQWTGVPIKKLTEKESDRLLHMEEVLHKRMVGQDEAIAAVSQAVRRSRLGLGEAKRPVGSFIFLGPTGVGKTELARTLADFLFDSEEAMVRIDMSEYMEKFSVSRLIGAPPGYVGYEEGGQLTEAVRRKPYSVVLLDEIEKAHPDVFNILLQVLDDGQLTDNLGHRVNFKNTLIIMTSNIGTEMIAKGAPLGFQPTDEKFSYEKLKKTVLEETKRTFRPEFLNRIDAMVVFHPLSKEDMGKIVGLLLARVKKRLKGKKIEIKVEEPVKDFLVEKGFDAKYGARPLQRAIQRWLEDPLAEAILAKKIVPTKPVLVTAGKDNLDFKNI